MKRFTATILLLVAICSIAFAWYSFHGMPKKFPPSKLAITRRGHLPDKTFSKKIKSKALEAKRFAATKGYNSKYCFLVDMSISSGQNRFFVYDTEKDSIARSGLVTHGRCNENWLEGRRYGNTVGCGCTSLGKYKVGIPYMGRFGLAFKLHGLDKTNDKAYDRFVVLHSHECVPEGEVGREICQSDGCPTVSPEFLKQLEPIIRNADKPVLLWIFE